MKSHGATFRTWELVVSLFTWPPTPAFALADLAVVTAAKQIKPGAQFKPRVVISHPMSVIGPIFQIAPAKTAWRGTASRSLPQYGSWCTKVLKLPLCLHAQGNPEYDDDAIEAERVVLLLESKSPRKSGLSMNLSALTIS